MDTELFSQFAPAIAAGAACNDSRLLMARDGNLEVFYAPFEAVNRDARVVLVGITPGAHQAGAALVEARRQLAAGTSHEDAMCRAKQMGAFAGAMRNNLVRMLDHVGFPQWLGLNSAGELFSQSAHLLHSTSVLQFPVFKAGGNYNGTPKPMRTPLLRRFVHEHFAKLGQQMPKAVFVPLGPVPAGVLQDLCREGHFRSEQVLPAIPHPAGGNNERIGYFLGTLRSEKPSIKTNPAVLDAARAELRSKVAALA